MALFNTALFGGALFAGVLFGEQATIDNGAGGPPVKKSHAVTYWHWTGSKFIHASTIDAIQEAIAENPNAPKILVAKKEISLPKPPKNPEKIGQYLIETVKFADKTRGKLKAQTEQDEMALILATLGLIESDQLVIV